MLEGVALNSIKKRRIRQASIFVIITLILIITFGVCIGVGSVQYTLKDVFATIINRASVDSTMADIIWDIRVPRAIAALFGGAALAVSGIMLQVFFRNPIVEPFVLGISSGAVFMVALVTLGGFTIGFVALSPFVVFIAALIGSAVVMAVVVAFASKVKDIVTLLVIGLMVGYICSAATNLMVAFADKEALQGFMVWTMGSFSGFTWDSVWILILCCVPTITSLAFIMKPLNAFLLGEEYAKSMGVNVVRFRMVLVLIASILTAIVTAFAGPIAFIGLAVPHITRQIFSTSDNRILVPGTVIMGGLVTSICDLIARTLFAPVELPISAVTAFIGAPIVIYLILKRRNSL